MDLNHTLYGVLWVQQSAQNIHGDGSDIRYTRDCFRFPTDSHWAPNCIQDTSTDISCRDTPQTHPRCSSAASSQMAVCTGCSGAGTGRTLAVVLGCRSVPDWGSYMCNRYDRYLCGRWGHLNCCMRDSRALRSRCYNRRGFRR